MNENEKVKEIETDLDEQAKEIAKTKIKYKKYKSNRYGKQSRKEYIYP